MSTQSKNGAPMAFNVPGMCDHPEFVSQTQVSRIINPVTQRGEAWIFVARVWCKACRVEMGFNGLANNNPGPAAPYVGHYGTHLRAPLTPALLAPLYGENPQPEAPTDAAQS